MIYILIISLLIKKPFYLLRRQSFSFEIVSEFSNFMSRGGAFDSLFCPGGRVFVHNYCPGGRVFAPFESCPGGLSRGGDGFGWNWYLHKDVLPKDLGTMLRLLRNKQILVLKNDSFNTWQFQEYYSRLSQTITLRSWLLQYLTSWRK